MDLTDRPGNVAATPDPQHEAATQDTAAGDDIYDVTIIGAGPTGLGAARLLCGAGPYRPT